MVAIPPYEPMPLRSNDDGVILIGNTRVPLDTVIDAYNDGNTPEDIVRQYTSLDLADVYSTIAYYLHHREAITAYLQQREEHGAAVRRENEARFDPTGVLEHLLARRQKL
jgi:uncharacterized protein (DUF433 family)